MKKYLLTGLLTAVPIWITWLIISFIFGLISDAGLPLVDWLIKLFSPTFPGIIAILEDSVFRGVLAIIVILVLLYLLGWIATRVVGQRILDAADRLIDRIPIIKTVYGGSKRLLESFQKKQDTEQRVVLINYPSPEMKTIGLITRTIVDKDSGKQLAAVYVPTTPNPTSGFLEIVPLEDVVMTDWTVNEAIAFIVSGGAVGRENINYLKSVSIEDVNSRIDNKNKIEPGN